MSLRAQSQAPCLTSSPESLTAAFVKFCRVQQITTRNLCRVGYITRQYTPGPARAASTSSSSSSSVPTSTTSPVLRGLIANKDIAKDENIVMMPERACLHHGVALRCQPFMNLIPTEVQQEHFLTRAFVLNSRVANGALIRHHQLLLALYMTYLYLSHTHAPSTLAALPDAKWMGYLNFLPRTEGDFALLKQHLTGWLYGTPVCRTLQKKLASHFGIDEENVRDALCYALCMLYSRSVPVDHYATLEYAFRGTAVAEYVTALKPLSTNGLVSEPVTFMAPLIDLCNHSEFENVAVMIPDRPLSSASTEPVICLRSLRDIAKNEELTMTYGGSPRELSLIWAHMLQRTHLCLRPSNARWLLQQAADTFVHEARRQGYVARSALKLTYLDDRYHLFRRFATRMVIDLGCSPGGWCQVIRQRAGDECHIIGLDLLNVRASIANAVFLQGDFTSAALQSALLRQLKTATSRDQNHLTCPRDKKSLIKPDEKDADLHTAHRTGANQHPNRNDEAGDTHGVKVVTCDELVTSNTQSPCVDVVTSDMCPNRVGGPQDRHRIAALNEKALHFSLPLLRTGGHFVCKVLGSRPSYERLYDIAQENFHTVHICKPPASRTNSDESFLVAHMRLDHSRRLCHKRYSKDSHSTTLAQNSSLDDWPGFARRPRKQ